MFILMKSETIRQTIEVYAKHVPVQILERYAALIDTEPIAWLYILQPGDSAELLQALRGQPFETWEYIDRLDGWYEAIFVISDDGFGHVVLVPDQPDTDPNILSLCQAHAVEAESQDDIST